MEKKELENIYINCKQSYFSSTKQLEKMRFENYLDALFLKTVKSKNKGSENQLQVIDWMKNWLENQAHFTIIQGVQSKLIIKLEQDIFKIQTENEKLLEEINNLKKNI